MLRQCNEHDFYRIMIVSKDRLSPDRIVKFFWAAFVFSGIITAVLLFGSRSNVNITNPIWSVIVKTGIILLVIQFTIAVFYMREKNAYHFQKLQSLLLSIISLKMSFELYFIYFLLCDDRFAPSYLKTTAITLFVGGLVYLIFTTFRGIKKVQQGELRKDGSGLYNIQQSKSNISLPIIFGATMMGGAISRTLSNSSNTTENILGLYFFLLLCVILQYTIAFAWPELFLLTYCKFKFESFQIPMSKQPRSNKKQTMPFKTQRQEKREVNIKRAPIEFHHVISTITRCKTDEWYYTALNFEGSVIRTGLKSTGTIIYKVANFNEATNEAHYTFYIPVNTAIEMEENDKYIFNNIWTFDDGLILRNGNLDENMEHYYELLRTKAKADHLKLEEPFYHILKGDGYVHIYAPIVIED
ncbi:hypothetical protein H1Z61_00210 [Bacillus aquiflavi]|uniref:Uncharacterized protein n=1 Tax=Bacillus aquiflavi TaxID=2672567 RepID=A0A6B3VWT5_9BACI|nr:hypothetical protein [Bacillus aquiflavi]MBA4535590.1 hypothetical protein [Bacillus aquiflavi]NEY79966.1 hypothetical protein [Bacillus aquiflavi]UAC48908.1 hypothetical protein K6959_03040 [Bacillus aquiflavi]